MKKSIIFMTLGLIIILQSCSTSQQTEKATVNRSQELKAIENVLEQYIIANENKDLTLVEQIWAPDGDIILYGTSSKDRLMGWNNIRNAFKNQFETLDNIFITTSEQYIKLNDSGTAAWFAEILKYNFMKDGKARELEGLRFTGVLKHCSDGKWRIVQAHLSIPASED
jgi:ketosteroid isomerase-like protein